MRIKNKVIIRKQSDTSPHSHHIITKYYIILKQLLPTTYPGISSHPSYKFHNWIKGITYNKKKANSLKLELLETIKSRSKEY